MDVEVGRVTKMTSMPTWGWCRPLDAARDGRPRPTALTLASTVPSGGALARPVALRTPSLPSGRTALWRCRASGTAGWCDAAGGALIRCSASSGPGRRRRQWWLQRPQGLDQLLPRCGHVAGWRYGHPAGTCTRAQTDGTQWRPTFCLASRPKTHSSVCLSVCLSLSLLCDGKATIWPGPSRVPSPATASAPSPFARRFSLETRTGAAPDPLSLVSRSAEPSSGIDPAPLASALLPATRCQTATPPDSG